MILDAANQVAELRALDMPPFPLDFHPAMCTVPPVGGPPNNDSAIHYANVIEEVNRIKALYSKTPNAPDAPKPAGILHSAKCTKGIEFNSAFIDDGLVVAIGSLIDPKLNDDNNVSSFL
jgi:hypothetical protein